MAGPSEADGLKAISYQGRDEAAFDALFAQLKNDKAFPDVRCHRRFHLLAE